MDYKNKYLKYKNKYLNLKKQNGGANLEIVIDTIKFTLLAKYINLDEKVKRVYGRPVVLLSSEKDDNINYFLIYRSNSEATCWRFYSIDSSIFSIWKGSNYVSQTFIHMDLQKFINNNFHLIPLCEKIPSDDVHIKIQNYFNEQFNKFLAIKNILEKTSIKKEVLAYLISIYKNFKQKLINKCILNFIAIPYINYYIDNRFSQCLSESRFKKYNLLEILDIDKIKCGHTTFRSFVINILEDKSKETNNVVMNSIIEKKKPEINDKNIISKYYEIINLYLKNINLTYDISTLKFLYATQHDFLATPDTPRCHFIINFYSIEIKVGDDIFILYFIKYIYNKYKDKSPEFSAYNAILNIVPKTNTINICGVNNEILSLGLYICKIIEYKDLYMKDNIEDRSINTSYDFIGDMINNMYPLSEFCDKLDFVSEDIKKVETDKKYIPSENIDSFFTDKKDDDLTDYDVYFIQPFDKLPEKFKDIKIDFHIFDDKIFEILQTPNNYSVKSIIYSIKNNIKVSIEYTNDELLLWMNYQLNFPIKVLNTLFIKFNVK